MYLETTKISCGVRQLYYLHGSVTDRNSPHFGRAALPIDLVKFVAQKKAGGQRFSTVVFSDSKRRNYGRQLALFIKEKKLGSLSSSAQLKNANTGREIKTWVWNPDFKAIDKLKVR